MACRCVASRSVMLLDNPWRPAATAGSRPDLGVRVGFPSPRSRSFSLLRPRFTDAVRADNGRVRCSHDDAAAASSSSHGSEEEQGPPQQAVLKAISEVSKAEGRIAQTTNLVIGGTVATNSSDEWLVLDQKVNQYPTVRGFTAIGTEGDDFVKSMVVAVESVLREPIPKARITQRISSRGKYVSVNIGPIRVVSSKQVQAVYNAMRRDDRMKYFL